MGVDEPDTIDAIATDDVTGELVLLISDHLNWTDEQRHLAILQAKINAYFGAIPQIRDQYPASRERGIRIDCLCSFPAPASTDWFAEEVRKAAAPLDVDFNFKTLPEEASEIAEHTS